MGCEFAEFLGLNGHQVSQQRALLMEEKEGSNLPDSQSSNAEPPVSQQCD